MVTKRRQFLKHIMRKEVFDNLILTGEIEGKTHNRKTKKLSLSKYMVKQGLEIIKDKQNVLIGSKGMKLWRAMTGQVT